MVLKSEGQALKYVAEPPRDKKYCLVSYAKMLAEHAQVIPAETATELVCALIESVSPMQKAAGFQIATSVRQGTEEMLVDGAIDQTFAFGRQQFI
jgi:hypothetical protein